MTGISPSEIDETQEGCHEEVDDCFTVVLPLIDDERLKKSERYVSKMRKGRRGHRVLPLMRLQDLPLFQYLNKNHAIEPQQRWNKMRRHESFNCKETHSLLSFEK